MVDLSQRGIECGPEITSVGQRLGLTMGWPGGGLVSLWILGSKYSCGVLGLSKSKKLATLWG